MFAVEMNRDEEDLEGGVMSQHASGGYFVGNLFLECEFKLKDSTKMEPNSNKRSLIVQKQIATWCLGLNDRCNRARTV